MQVHRFNPITDPSGDGWVSVAPSGVLEINIKNARVLQRRIMICQRWAAGTAAASGFKLFLLAGTGQSDDPDAVANKYATPDAAVPGVEYTLAQPPLSAGPSAAEFCTAIFFDFPLHMKFTKIRLQSLDATNAGEIYIVSDEL